MRRTTTLLCLTMAAIMALPLAAPAEEADLHFLAPTAAGVAELGRDVAFALGGSCDAAVVTPLLLVSGETVGEGASAVGCEGVVTVPTTGLEAEGADLSIALRAENGNAEATRTLRPHRLQAEHLTVVAGGATTAPSQDPWGGGDALAIADADTVVSLGVTDLTGITSASFRWATPTPASEDCLFAGVPTIQDWNCPTEAPSVRIHRGAPDGPVVLDWNVPTQATTAGWHDYERTIAPILDNDDGPVELFLSVSGSGGPDGLVNLNWIDLNGSGVASPHTFSEDRPGTVWMFDGTPESLEPWRWADGTGSGEFLYVPEERAIVSNGSDSYTLFFYEPQQFADFVFRTEFRVESWEDNSGVFVRFPYPQDQPDVAVHTGHEIQIEERGLWGPNNSQDTQLKQTGAIYGLEGPERLATNAIGEWNTLEIRVVGQQYDVAINGRHVTSYASDRLLTQGYIGLQAENDFRVWYRDVRALPCSGPSDPGCGLDLIDAPVVDTTAPCQPASWVATWTMPQADADTTYVDTTLRIVPRVSLGGDQVRVRLSNELGTEPVTFTDVHVGLPGVEAALVPGSNRPVTFGGQTSVTVAAGDSVVSDPVAMAVPDFGEIAVSVFVPGEAAASGHIATTSRMYAATGNLASSEETAGFGWGEGGSRFLSAVDVFTVNDGAIVAFGDSITEGASIAEIHEGDQPPYSHELALRLAETARQGGPRLAVVNAGIGGNRLRKPNTGPSGLDRLDRDAFSHSGVVGLMMMEGINDLSPLGRQETDLPTFEQMTAAYEDVVAQAEAAGVDVWLSTMTPAGDPVRPTPLAFASNTPEQVQLRNELNEWIREHDTAYDPGVDFDRAIRWEPRPDWLHPDYDSGDNLHPNQAGLLAMARSIDLDIFAPLACAGA